MDEYAALLHAKWTSGGEAGSIIYGEWAEDGSRYELRVPMQLRDMLVSLQNALADRYQEIQSTRAKLGRLETEATVLLKGGDA
jgi:hypothetical protein